MNIRKIQKNIGATMNFSGGAEMTPKVSITRYYMPGSMNSGDKAFEIIQDGKMIHLSPQTMEAILKWGEETPEESNRVYHRQLVSAEECGADIFTVAEWKEAVENGSFVNYDGSGYWCKDGEESRDEVFSTEPEDATHVSWYNK